MKLQAAIFDRNNVLIEYDFAYAQAYFGPLLPISIWELGDRWQSWGETAGFPATPADEEPFWQGFWDHIGDDLGLAGPVRDTLHRFRYVDVLRPFPDARPTLLALRALGLRIGVLSNFPLATIESSLTAVNLLDVVDAALSSTNIGVAKPDPQAYWHMLHALNAPPEATLFVDDTLIHVTGAQNLGMAAYLLDRRRASSALAQGIIHKLSVLPALAEDPNSLQ
jgi:HAD superfamily hydrolase (TIGR01509 family)